MILEGGSQNASRIPGQYAYPVQRYQSNPIESVSAIRGNGLSHRHPINTDYRTSDSRGPAETSSALQRSRETYPRKELFRPDMYEARRPAADSRNAAASLARDLEQSREPGDSYANSVFRARSDVSQGLFVNLLG
ncbi:MAG: hypothetical protein NXI24_15450 [bacterium]|nr:hypothetical protein [bacterium]